jgi:thioredoxin-related protein
LYCNTTAGNVETASHSNHTKGSSSSKQKTLAELFKPPTDIMFQGTFQEARVAGQMQNKWLLVNIQDSREFRCQVLNRDVWNNHQVKKIISNQFIFLQIQHITDDGIRFRQLYEVEGCPIIMVIDPRTGQHEIQ